MGNVFGPSASPARDSCHCLRARYTVRYNGDNVGVYYNKDTTFFSFIFNDYVFYVKCTCVCACVCVCVCKCVRACVRACARA